jgi:LacI family transcriptional regulator
MAPPLTTIAVDAKDLGERAARMLLAQIGARSPRTEIYVGEAQLIVRESCGERRGAGLPAAAANVPP